MDLSRQAEQAGRRGVTPRRQSTFLTVAKCPNSSLAARVLVTLSGSSSLTSHKIHIVNRLG